MGEANASPLLYNSVMYRYCQACQKEFEVQIKKMEDVEIIHCPYCGKLVDKNSKKPTVQPGELTAEKAATNVFIWLAKLHWIIYPIFSALGILFFFLNLSMPLYVVTGLSLLYFFYQHGKSFIMILPIGCAAVAYYYFKTYEGACFGVAVSWAIWHLIRIIKWAIVSKLIEEGNK